MLSVGHRVAAYTRGQTNRFNKTIHELSTAQKIATSGAPPYSVYVNRRLGKYVAAAAYLAGWSPNRVSCVSAALTFSGILLLASGPAEWWVGTIVWILLATGYAFDSADGQVARLNGSGSPAGEWLDHVLDSAKLSSLHLAVLVCAYRNFNLPNEEWLLIPIAFTIVAAVSFFSMILNDHLKIIHSHDERRKPLGKSPSISKSILLIPTDYGVLCLLFLSLGSPTVFFTIYVLFFVANASHLLLASIKWFNDMRKMAPALIDTHL
ncbi:CDP-alcohol phosphatidyltransferase family protein [Arthrobacter humicola]|jgi:phosphatidylglycerophosphate synthase